MPASFGCFQSAEEEEEEYIYMYLSLSIYILLQRSWKHLDPVIGEAKNSMLLREPHGSNLYRTEGAPTRPTDRATDDEMTTGRATERPGR